MDAGRGSGCGGARDLGRPGGGSAWTCSCSAARTRGGERQARCPGNRFVTGARPAGSPAVRSDPRASASGDPGSSHREVAGGA